MQVLAVLFWIAVFGFAALGVMNVVVGGILRRQWRRNTERRA